MVVIDNYHLPKLMSNPITFLISEYLDDETTRDSVLVLKSMVKDGISKNEIIKEFTDLDNINKLDILNNLYLYVELSHSLLDEEKSFNDFFTETLEENVNTDYDNPHILSLNLDDINNTYTILQEKIDSKEKFIKIELQFCDTDHLARLIEIDCGELPAITTEEDINDFMLRNSYLPCRKIRLDYIDGIIPVFSTVFVSTCRNKLKTS